MFSKLVSNRYYLLDNFLFPHFVTKQAARFCLASLNRKIRSLVYCSYSCKFLHGALFNVHDLRQVQNITHYFPSNPKCFQGSALMYVLETLS